MWAMFPCLTTSPKRTSRFEADRAEKLLSAAVGRQVEVDAGARLPDRHLEPEVTIKDKLESVIILDHQDLPSFRPTAAAMPPSVRGQAGVRGRRRSTTWSQPT